jgi:hypothetical protein
MHTRCHPFLIAFLAFAGATVTLTAQEPPKPGSPKLKDEMRMPWARSNERFIRRWLVLSDIPLDGNGFDRDWLAEHGGEAGIKPVEHMTHKLPGGGNVEWRPVTAWGDATDLSDGKGLKRDILAYAHTTVKRESAGKALLCLGSDESIRVWVNGAQVLDKRTRRQLVFDEDKVEVDLKAGDNSLLVKVEQHTGPWVFSARVLERGAIPPRVQEIGPSLFEDSTNVLTVRTDVDGERAAQDKVKVEAVGAGGSIFAQSTASRGESVRFSAAAWPDGAYEIRCSTRTLAGLLYVTHLPWYKGDAVAASRRLVAAAEKADAARPEGFTMRMLADLVRDRLGKDLSVTGNPWWAVHAALMEFEELQLEAAGKAARIRPYGFYRLAYRDEIDGSPQFCRAYLPGGYNRSQKWPLVVRLHGYNPANPGYVKWWSVDLRHNMADQEYANGQGISRHRMPAYRSSSPIRSTRNAMFCWLPRLLREACSSGPRNARSRRNSTLPWKTPTCPPARSASPRAICGWRADGSTNAGGPAATSCSREMRRCVRKPWCCARLSRALKRMSRRSKPARGPTRSGPWRRSSNSYGERTSSCYAWGINRKCRFSR